MFSNVKWFKLDNFFLIFFGIPRPKSTENCQAFTSFVSCKSQYLSNLSLIWLTMASLWIVSVCRLVMWLTIESIDDTIVIKKNCYNQYLGTNSQQQVHSVIHQSDRWLQITDFYTWLMNVFMCQSSVINYFIKNK